jgi:putative spermidine/putrescine transport system ATP-binding protein
LWNSLVSNPNRSGTKNDFDELRLVGVTRRFAAGTSRSMAALDHLSLVVRRGEFVALLGPSGCGKSTALNCIAGLLPLSSGSIWLDDTRIDLYPPEKRGFGMVFQNYALFPHMTVRKNVGFGLLMRRVPADQRRNRVEHALQLVQLDGQGDKLPGQLSGGQQQRVAIARAIVVEPALVLMDEPLSNLDAKLRIETRAEIRRIHRELGRTTIYVTHDQDEALSLADRIVVLRAGIAQQVAPPHEIYTQPANLHVARFMGYRNVIDFEATQEPQAGRVSLRREGMTLAGTALQPLPAGGRVSAAIRPDDFAIAAAQGPNTVSGVVANVEYGGRDSLIDVSVTGGVRLHVRTSSPVAPGDRLNLSVPQERVLVYAGD